MSRLTAIPSRLAPAGRKLGPAPGDSRAQDRERGQLKPWRKWYFTARWKRLRLQILDRDGWTCRQTGVPLVGPKDAPDSPVVDHIQEHKGDSALFWDPENLQAVSKAWHDSEKQRQERARHG